MECFLEFLVECCCEGGCELCGEAASSDSRTAWLVADIMMAVTTLGGIAMTIAGGVMAAQHYPDKEVPIGLLVAGGAVLLGGFAYFLATRLVRHKKRKKLETYILQESAQENIEQNQYRRGVLEQGAVQPSLPNDETQTEQEEDESDGKEA